ncbi:MAG: bifunctional pyr operon transcriptional regulator/uracil phosphoribosyltransferase PyrR [Planctomycetes bacterium]|nr:bifunctional pyr operon transcriptional regulator/uracil phosphoribosyltransferase PyrR [Planctomycetota bacterium]
MIKGKKILSPGQIKTLIQQLAHSILSQNKKSNSTLTGTSLALIGIHKRGIPLARRLQTALNQKTKTDIPLGWLDITLYRDDLETIGHVPVVKGTKIEFDLTDKNIILVDDVLFTGRTIRSALDELIDFGRPRSIQLAVLVDRGHRELPIQADYIGQTIETKNNEIVDVKLTETDGVDEVWLGKK